MSRLTGWHCDECGGAIRAGEGYVVVTDSEGRGPSTRRLLVTRVLHTACDPAPTARAHRIDVVRVDDANRFLRWARQVRRHPWGRVVDDRRMLHRLRARQHCHRAPAPPRRRRAS